MTVLITIRSPSRMTNAAIGNFIAAARERECQLIRRPRSLLRRLLDALKPDERIYKDPIGYNTVPSMAFRYECGDFVFDSKVGDYVPCP